LVKPKITMPKFNITVIGGGHAGIEAAHIAAKMGVSVLLVTGHVDLIGQMPCNPAIGGIAKGNIVREIDALGGLMGFLIDRAGIHFRMLNCAKGSAVWGPRAQADRVLYKDLARREIENCPNIAILQAMVTKIGVSGGKIASVTLDNGEIIDTGAVIVAAGTFLNGVMHVGLSACAGGRAGEPAVSGLTESINALGIESGRLNTCTPPRIDGRSVDYSKLEEQRGDDEPWPFSFFTKGKLVNRIVCWAAKTNAVTHKYILDNLDRSPLRAGKIQSASPRYCPSIEDKVIRFGERDGHTLYLEPEGPESRELYVNGLTTSLPYDVQERMVRSVAGLENARIMRPGYGIEYDYFNPLQLQSTLESRAVAGLFFAGQVNGTSGYEEAACQGLIAGINAVRALRGEEPVVLGRDTSYIGVLIDDLVTKGTDEPYRMFTSRAECRLILRQDNCDERLMPIAHGLGTLSDERYGERRRFWDRKREVTDWLYGVKVTPDEYNRLTGRNISQTESVGNLLRRPEVGIAEFFAGPGVDNPQACGQNVDTVGMPAGSGEMLLFDRHLSLGIESDIKYEGFVRKQIKEIEKIRRFENTRIPDSFSYDAVPGLLTESRQKLKNIRPDTLGKASRIGGVTPADISVLAMYLLKSEFS
jgi:tRNA uridine 5-carboxymethylaminomethyl modification enzyme